MFSQGPPAVPITDAVVLSSRCLAHPNRFVRESTAILLGRVCELLKQSDVLVDQQLTVAELLKQGLTDNWSQVHSHSILTHRVHSYTEIASERAKSSRQTGEICRRRARQCRM